MQRQVFLPLLRQSQTGSYPPLLSHVKTKFNCRRKIQPGTIWGFRRAAFAFSNSSVLLNEKENYIKRVGRLFGIEEILWARARINRKLARLEGRICMLASYYMCLCLNFWLLMMIDVCSSEKQKWWKERENVLSNHLEYLTPMTHNLAKLLGN